MSVNAMRDSSQDCEMEPVGGFDAYEIIDFSRCRVYIMDGSNDFSDVDHTMYDNWQI